jgi:steroid 5-alpha reductase family enzyme
MKLKYFIDSNKGITFLVLLALIAYYRQWSNPTAMLYLALHGTYGLMWVLKSRLFPDKQWEQPAPVWFGLLSWAALALYWLPGWIIISRPVQAPAWVLAACTSIYTFGVFFHFSSDMQKFTALKLRPGNLITEGLFGLARNINYFGEFAIYGAMAALAMSWAAFLPLAAFMLFYWIPNMVRKERSLARYPEFAEYRRKTARFIPYIF